VPKLDEFEVGKFFADLPKPLVIKAVAVKVDPLKVGPASVRGEGEKRCQDSFLGLPRGRRVDWRFRFRAIACTQFSCPKGVPRLTQLRTALSSVAVGGLLTRSVQRDERAIGQAQSRRGSRSGSSSHRLSEHHL
jgi:hypothetical protein